MPLNPDCTPGWAWEADDGTHTAYCGCGWTEPGFPSRRKALRAQRDHRFPPLEPADRADRGAVSPGRADTTGTAGSRAAPRAG